MTWFIRLKQRLYDLLWKNEKVVPAPILRLTHQTYSVFLTREQMYWSAGQCFIESYRNRPKDYYPPEFVMEHFFHFKFREWFAERGFGKWDYRRHDHDHFKSPDQSSGFEFLFYDHVDAIEFKFAIDAFVDDRKIAEAIFQANKAILLKYYATRDESILIQLKKY